jgi:hypothetical protein
MLMHNGTNVAAAEEYCESVFETDPEVHHPPSLAVFL